MRGSEAEGTIDDWVADIDAAIAKASANACVSVREPNIGDVQIGDASEYDGLGEGFVIEEFDGDYWEIPDWAERGKPHLEGVFRARAEAEAALRS